MLKDSGVSASGRVVGLVLQTAHLAIVARLLPQAALADLVAAIALLSILGGIAELGLLQTAARRFAVRSSERTTSEVATLALTGGVLGAAAAAAIGALAFDAGGFHATVVLLPWFVVARLDVGPAAALLAEGRFGRLAAAEVVSRLALVLSVAAPLAAGLPTGVEPLSAIAFGLLLSEVVLLLWLTGGRVTVLRPGRLRAARHLAYESAPLAVVNGVSAAHARIDQVVLGALRTGPPLAAYAIVARVVDAAVAVASSVGLVGYSSVVSAPTESQKRYGERVVGLLGALAAVVGIVALHSSPFYLRVLGGEEYVEYAGVGRLASCVVFVAIANSGYAQLVIAANAIRALVPVGLTAVALNASLTVVLGHRYDAAGAVLATIATEVFGLVAVVEVCRRRVDSRRSLVELAGPLAAFLLGGPAAYLVGVQYHWLLSVGCVAMSAVLLGRVVLTMAVVRQGVP